jgi:NadR type nicotinamide-nucleotide adenylyltransferase
MLKKVVIIGPESTGKSSLCEQLANHYKTNWVPEYAREYLLKNGMNYTYEDLLVIAKGQLQLEDNLIPHPQGSASLSPAGSSGPLTFIDTDMYVMKVWCEYVFNKCHKFILDAITKRKYDLYLLCNTDLPWVKDELREYPNLAERERLFKIYKDCMVNQSTPWTIIEGNHKTRLLKAVEAVDILFS